MYWDPQGNYKQICTKKEARIKLKKQKIKLIFYATKYDNEDVETLNAYITTALQDAIVQLTLLSSKLNLIKPNWKLLDMEQKTTEAINKLLRTRSVYVINTCFKKISSTNLNQPKEDVT